MGVLFFRGAEAASKYIYKSLVMMVAAGIKGPR
jgi:hypothetical protein